MEHLTEEQLVLHHYRDDDSPAMAAQHLIGCAQCRREYDSMRSILAMVDELPTPDRGPGYGDQVWNRLRWRMDGGGWLVAGQSVAGSDYPIGSSGGHETVKLSAGQVPSHSHAVRANSGASSTKNPTNSVPAFGGAYAATQNAKMNTVMLAKSGGGQAHENRQPYLSLNYIIALEGIFPSRS